MASRALKKAGAHSFTVLSNCGKPLGGAWKIMTTRGRLKTMLPGGPQRGSLGSYEKARLARRLCEGILSLWGERDLGLTGPGEGSRTSKVFDFEPFV